MKTITKNCMTCNKSFEADLREHNRGNAKYCSLSCCAKNQKKTTIYQCTCIHCKKSFNAKFKNRKYCSKNCKQKYYRKQQLTTEYSTKALQIALKDLPCEICGWQESTRDMHHIIPVSKGGKNLVENVIILCPNHHRMIHNNLISKDALQRAFKLRLSLHPELFQEQDAQAGITEDFTSTQ